MISILISPQAKYDPFHQQVRKKLFGISKSHVFDANLKPACFVHRQKHCNNALGAKIICNFKRG